MITITPQQAERIATHSTTDQWLYDLEVEGDEILMTAHYSSFGGRVLAILIAADGSERYEQRIDPSKKPEPGPDTRALLDQMRAEGKIK